MRLIDADELIAECKRMVQDSWNNGTAPVSWAEAYATFIDDIETCETVPAYGQWISVKDRMPKQFQRVLICRRRRYGQLYWGNIGIDLGHEVIQNRHGDITHWMPLPEPPEKGE